MKEGDIVYTRRFCHVQIKHIYRTREEAVDAGYIIDAKYAGEPGFGIAGRTPDPIGHPNRMIFAAYREPILPQRW